MCLSEMRNMSAEGVAVLRIPQESAVTPPQIIDLLSILDGRRYFGEPSLEVARLVADAIAVQESPVQHIAVIGSGSCDHDRLMGVDITQHRDMPRSAPTDSGVINAITGEFLIVGSFTRKHELVGIDQGSKAIHQFHIRRVKIGRDRMSVVRREAVRSSAMVNH